MKLLIIASLLAVSSLAHANDFDPCRNMAAYTAKKVELTGSDKDSLLKSGFEMCRLGQEDGAKSEKNAFADVTNIHNAKLNSLIPGTREYIFEDWLFSFYTAGFIYSTADKKSPSKAAKDTSDIDELLGGMSSSKKAEKKALADAKEPVKKAGPSGASTDSYIGGVQAAIQSKFYKSDDYKGKRCSVLLKLNPDGSLLSATRADGDVELCNSAIQAIKVATLPKPPSAEVFEAVKSATLEFRP